MTGVRNQILSEGSAISEVLECARASDPHVERGTGVHFQGGSRFPFIMFNVLLCSKNGPDEAGPNIGSFLGIC